MDKTTLYTQSACTLTWLGVTSWSWYSSPSSGSHVTARFFLAQMNAAAATAKAKKAQPPTANGMRALLPEDSAALVVEYATPKSLGSFEPERRDFLDQISFCCASETVALVVGVSTGTTMSSGEMYSMSDPDPEALS